MALVADESDQRINALIDGDGVSRVVQRLLGFLVGQLLPGRHSKDKNLIAIGVGLLYRARRESVSILRY